MLSREPANPVTPSHLGRVLVVDDDVGVGACVSMLLEQAGYSCEVCNSGRAGLQKLREEEFEAVISDLRMPDASGLDIVAAARERNPDAVVMLMTSYSSIESAIEALRPHTQSKLIIVLGAGGDRDEGKRPEMGAAAVRLADRVIVTDDNPRSEDPARIRAAIMAAAPGATEVAGRREAIRLAISEAEAGDIVLLAGKGHEQGQIVGDRVLPFDDVSVAREEAA